MAILPGENMEDSVALGEALFREWNPDGPTETDAVFTIAKCMWRKLRIQKFIYAKIAIRQFTPGHPAFDPELATQTLKATLLLDPTFLERLFTQHPEAKEAAATHKPKHLRDLVSPAEMSEKIKAALKEMPLGEPEPSSESNLMAIADILSEDLFQKELAMEERLDAAIDRAVKRLVQAKAVKQMLASPYLNGQLNGKAQRGQPGILASNRAEPQPSTQDH
jgi:hypothetical protein